MNKPILKTSIVIASMIACKTTVAEARSITVSPHLDAVTINDDSWVHSSVQFAVNNIKDSNKRTASFNKSAKQIGLNDKIKDCSMLIELPVGRADGNRSYGAYCKLVTPEKTVDVELCNDDMVGHFALYNTLTLVKDKQSLIEFVASNCVGG